jgi:hypothetical protein
MNDISEEDKKKWGLDILTIALRTKDYGWDNINTPDKKHMLTDLHLYDGKIDISALASHWRETGHSEWEYLLSAWLIFGVIDASKNNEEHADISIMFTRDLIATRERRFTKEQIYKHIMPSFEKVNEDDENIYLRLRVA